jgi:hypothetical protein
MKKLEARILALEAQIEILKKEVEASKMIEINRHEVNRILTDRTHPLNRDAQSEELGRQLRKLLSDRLHIPFDEQG